MLGIFHSSFNLVFAAQWFRLGSNVFHTLMRRYGLGALTL